MNKDDSKPTWEMTYDEIWKAWSDKYSFGAKGELSIQEAKDVHNLWKRLGSEAKFG